MTSSRSGQDDRMVDFVRNKHLEKLLKSINSELWEAEKLILPAPSQEMELPVILIVGPIRTGSTLFLQWLANTGLVATPTNLLSRFYQAPILGTKIQLMLTDPRYNFRDELGVFNCQVEYESDNGKTKDMLSPNEFWYFWRRFLADPSRDVWTDSELRSSMDVQLMKSELIGMMDVCQKPFAAKGMLFNYNIPFLDSILDKVIFIQMKRDPVSNVASVLGARERQFGKINQWYSFKIPEYEQLIKLSPLDQISGQIFFNDIAVTKGLAQVAEHRKHVIHYENLCDEPEKIYDELVEKLIMSDQHFVQKKYRGVKKFNKTRSLTTEETKKIKAALSKFQQ